jgi:hypothetical protein
MTVRKKFSTVAEARCMMYRVRRAGNEFAASCRGKTCTVITPVLGLHLTAFHGWSEV